MSGVGLLVDLLAGVPDPRDPRGVRHSIGAVLSVMVFAVLAGARNFRETADQAEDLPTELLAAAGCRQCPLTGRYMVPSEPTMRRVAHGIDADDTDVRVCRWMREHAAVATIARQAGDTPSAADSGLVAVAMDGKVVRNTIAPGGAEGGEIKLFSALLHEEAIVIAQRRIPDGTNEITQVKALLAEIDLTNVVVTGDAAHARHATAAHIVCERGGAYALTVKGNQPGLLAAINAALPPAAPGSEHHVETDRGNGKIVRRAIWVAPATGIDFPGAAQVFRIRRDTFDHAGNRLSKEIVHGVTSLPAAQADPEMIARLIRRHWGIENKSHWVRDVVYREDHQHAYAGTGAQVMATLRNLTLGLLRLAGITQITRTLQRIAADRARILPIIAAATSTNRL
ncbi:MAG: ISAs1 family transposase [Actinomycetota bacterium]|nr:ISAs1 family transposase [Actinomycetota bacterium]